MLTVNSYSRLLPRLPKFPARLIALSRRGSAGPYDDFMEMESLTPPADDIVVGVAMRRADVASRGQRMDPVDQS